MKLFPAALILIIAMPFVFGDTLIVGNKYASTVSFVDLKSGKEVVQPETGGSPHELALSPDGTQVVVVSYMDETHVGKELNVFDVANAKKIRTIDISPHLAPHGIGWIGDSREVLVTTEETKDVIKVNVDSGKVVSWVATNQIGTHMLALSPDFKRAYVTNRGSDTFCVIDVPKMKLLETLPVGNGPEGVDVSPDGKELWIGNNQSQDIYVFDTATLKQIDKIDVGYLPIRVRFSPDGKVVAAADLNGDRVVIYDAATRKKITDVVISDLSVSEPASLLFSSDGASLYTAAQKGAKVIEIDCKTWSVGRDFDVGNGSDGLAISPVTMKSITW